MAVTFLFYNDQRMKFFNLAYSLNGKSKVFVIRDIAVLNRPPKLAATLIL